MSELYTNIPQDELIKAIKIPVIRERRDAPWMKDPLSVKRAAPINRRKGVASSSRNELDVKKA